MQPTPGKDRTFPFRPFHAGQPRAIAGPQNGGWGWSISIGITLFIFYMANRIDTIGSEDTLPAEILPTAILRGDGLYLDRFDQSLTGNGRILVPLSMKRTSEGIISRYSIGSALVCLPLVAAQLAILDRIDPGWDKKPRLEIFRARRMAKVASACLAALTAVVLHRLLRRLGVGLTAVPATLAAALGSNVWVVASQAPWEHTSAVFLLTLSMFLMSPQPIGRMGLFLGGTTAAMMVWCRSIDLIFALAFLFRVAWERPRALCWFLPMPLTFGAALITYNLWFFRSVAGGLAELEELHPMVHHLQGTWSGRLGGGMAGTLFSPNRGLFVFSPWIPIALATLPATASRIRAWPLGIWLGGALLVNLIVLSKYAVWWGGHSFGPRYWTDAIPIFAVFFAFTLEWAWTRCRPLFVAAAAAILISIAIQAIGAFCFPSSWNGSPVEVDRDPGRLWDWSDSELTRCLSEGVKPWWTVEDPLWRKR